MAFGFGSVMNPAAECRAVLNLGCLMDIPTGSYYRGIHGESILVGGLYHMTGIGGRGNMFKSTIAHFMMLRVLDRYFQAAANFYDTENSMTLQRLYQLASRMEYIGGLDLQDEGRLLFTDNTVMLGDEWYDKLKEFSDLKVAAKKETWAKTPILDSKGNPIYAYYPSPAEIDSLSQFNVKAVEDMHDKNTIGHKDNNTDALKGASAKNQMIIEMPKLAAQAGLYLIMTAHVDDEIQMDPYAPKQKKLTFLKGGVKFKYVPSKINFLTNNLWYCQAAEVLTNKTTKRADYPLSDHEGTQGDTDLMKITLQNLRGKGGATGLPFDLVVSQHQGVLPSLTEFHYIKTRDGFGLGGTDKNYYVDLCPDIALQRTTVRSKIDENPRLQRALEITSEMAQMQAMWPDLPPEHRVTPKQLFEDLSAKGYDWGTLLDTRGYWVFEGSEHPKNYLSTRDLLNMRTGDYHPFWMAN